MRIGQRSRHLGANQVPNWNAWCVTELGEESALNPNRMARDKISMPNAARSLLQRIPMSSIQAVVLCGGMGTRLRGVVPQVPKALAPVGGRPFLDYLLA